MNAIRLRSLGLLLVVLLLATPSIGELLFAPTPYKTLSQTRRLLDAVDVRIMLPLGYEMAPELVRTSELSRRRGVVEVRVYVSGKERLELGLSATPRGMYDIVVYRQGEGGLGDLERRLQDLVGEASRASSSRSEPDLGYEMIRLGHMEADRALALLKALGYYTIEFNTKSQGGGQIFDLVRGKSPKLPWVIKVANASKTSLMSPGARTTTTRTTSSSSSKGFAGVLQLGGTHLHSATAGAPEERLLIVYDRDRPEDLETLVNLLQTLIDVPAQQIVIEVLVIEVNSSSLNDLGFEWRSSNRGVRASFERGSSGTRQGSFILSPNAFTDFNAFRGAIEALQESGDAEVLSSPSVLVLNDRQARIQVGRQIPVSRTTATTSSTIKSVEYFPIGIVLNLRPRINRERSEVTMQIEAIISSISPESAAKLEEGVKGDITFSPIVDSRQIETYVRVADGTPFIIGGLLSTDDQQARISLPLFSSLPLIGRLFTRQRVQHQRREVIVVLTPHIVPQDARSFSYLIPKDSDIFDRFDYTLFRNAYRVRDDEVWDLKFIQESPVLRNIIIRIRGHAQKDVTIRRQEPFASFLAGNIPGEEVLVRRMMKDIIEKLEYGDNVDIDKVFFFETAADDNLMDRGLNGALGEVLETPGRGLVLTYDARDEPKPGEYFTYPFATVRDTVVPEVLSGDDTERVLFLRGLNPVGEEDLPLQWSILLADEEDVAHLFNVLVLKRLLELNDKQPQTLTAFRPGLQILFPSREDMANRYHLIDKEVAQLFYETSASQYYPAFERVFNRRVREVENVLGPGGGG